MTTPTQPITIDDVRGVIGDQNPNETNALAVRKLLGDRGSNSTIQKYLKILREEYRSAQAVTDSVGLVPAMPQEFDAIWRIAYTAASNTCLQRLEMLSQERDAATSRLEVAENDLVVANVSCDEKDAQLSAAQVSIADLTASREEILVNARSELEVSKQQYENHLEAIANELNAVSHSLELEMRDRATERLSLEGVIDRQLQQLVELRSVIDRLRPVEA
jgi:hypothetical protein